MRLETRKRACYIRRMKLLLVEDDERLRAHLEECLRDHGFFTQSVASRDELLLVLNDKTSFDIIVMDRMIGPYDTKDLLGDLRKVWPLTPVLILSAISTPNERTDLINLGADDYLGKPFSTQELLARLRAQLRKTVAPIGNFLKVGNLVIDSVKRIISVEGQAEQLPPREFSLLRTLALDPNRIWSRDDLLDYVWGQSTQVETNVVEATVANLRRKLERLGANVTIRNLRNAGYWIKA